MMPLGAKGVIRRMIDESRSRSGRDTRAIILPYMVASTMRRRSSNHRRCRKADGHANRLATEDACQSVLGQMALTDEA
jgi:hypothetical protein